MEADKDRIRKEVSDRLRESLEEQYAPIETLFENVYDKLPRTLQRQQAELLLHVEKHKREYEVEFGLSQ